MLQPGFFFLDISTVEIVTEVQEWILIVICMGVLAAKNRCLELKVTKIPS